MVSCVGDIRCVLRACSGSAPSNSKTEMPGYCLQERIKDWQYSVDDWVVWLQACLPLVQLEKKHFSF